MAKRFQFFYESTPNPQSMKFYVAEPFADETVFFSDPTKCTRSPLAQKIFGFPWAQAVLIGPNFVTITKQEWVEWSILAEPLSQLLAEHLERGEGVLLEVAAHSPESGVSSDDLSAVMDSDSAVVKKIKEILNNEIRPAVAMDGGDIVFSKFENNRLFLHMQGACSGCPSSAMTLKDGIETRLKEAIPDLIEVVSI